MTTDQFRALARYNRWMNRKLYALAAELTDEDRKRDRGAFFKSIHGTLSHILLADRIWFARFSGDSAGQAKYASLDEDLYPSFDDLRRERDKTDGAVAEWIDALTSEQLAATFRYSRRGVAIEHPLWWAVLHFFNHQTHHRGQATTLFMQAGRDPGVTDLIAMLREEGVH